MKETYKVKLPKHIVIGDPNYFKEFTGSELERLTVDYDVSKNFTDARVTIESSPCEDMPELMLLDMTIYQAVSNLLKLNELAQTLMDRDNIQPLQFVEYLYIMISTNQEEDEADIPEIERNNGVVSLYSIHKAKGLSFPIVVIPNCDNKLNRPITKPKIILDLKSERPALAFNFENVSQSLMPDNEYNRMLDANVREQLEEEIRVFYVACTRAEKQIVIANTKSKEQVMQTLQYRDYASVSRWLLEMEKE